MSTLPRKLSHSCIILAILGLLPFSQAAVAQLGLDFGAGTTTSNSTYTAPSPYVGVPTSGTRGTGQGITAAAPAPQQSPSYIPQTRVQDPILAGQSGNSALPLVSEDFERLTVRGGQTDLRDGMPQSRTFLPGSQYNSNNQRLQDQTPQSSFNGQSNTRPARSSLLIPSLTNIPYDQLGPEADKIVVGAGASRQATQSSKTKSTQSSQASEKTVLSAVASNNLQNSAKGKAEESPKLVLKPATEAPVTSSTDQSEVREPTLALGKEATDTAGSTTRNTETTPTLPSLTLQRDPLESFSIVSYTQGDTSVPFASRNRLRNLAKAIQDESGKKVEIISYATEGIDGTSARVLSFARAVAVRKYLVNNGMNQSAIEIRSIANQDNTDRVDVNIL